MKKIIIIIAVVLGIAAISSLAVFTDGFKTWDIREVNEDNLVNVSIYDDTLEDKREDGIKVEVDENGVIEVTGENETNADVTINVCEVTLNKGEYTFGSSAKTDKKEYYMTLSNSDSTIVINDYDDVDDRTFKVDTETTFTLSIVVKSGEEIDVTFKPVLVEGDKEGKFFVIG